jgi:hypothetical protein
VKEPLAVGASNFDYVEISFLAAIKKLSSYFSLFTFFDFFSLTNSRPAYSRCSANFPDLPPCSRDEINAC